MPISKIYIDHNVKNYPLVLSILSKIDADSEIIDDPKIVFDAVHAADDPVQKGKETLFLTKNRGAFIKKCPGTKHYTCCGYKILHIGTFCVMDCSYCVLQAYFHPPLLQFYVNHDDLQKDLHNFFSTKTIARIGTGEFTDSLIWEPWTDLSAFLVPEFSRQSHAVLELKTKTTEVESLKKLTHNRKTIVSWSLNTDRVIRNEERGTCSLSSRLSAAARCESWGYPLSFHFDPMFIYEGCEKDYRDVVVKLFASVSRENIVWISLGTFRFMPGLKTIVQKRFKDSKIVYGEFIAGLDGKLRYFKPLRIDLYARMIFWIRELAPDVVIYFCMEDEAVWKKSTGFIPSERGGLSRMLDESATRHCGLDS